MLLSLLTLAAVAPPIAMTTQETTDAAPSAFLRGVAGEGAARTEYRLLAPENVDPEASYPLILFLHGSGERGADNEIQLKHFPERMVSAERRAEFPCYILAPQCPTGERWTTDDWGSTRSRPLPEDATAPMKGAIEALMDVVREHQVDMSRIYLTGLSMGGYGAWELAMRHPDWFAAVAPVCGGGDEQQAARLVGLPISVWHGDADSAVPVVRSQALVEALRGLGETPEYHELPGVNHDSWTQAYGDEGCLKWLFAQRRDPERRMRAAARLMAKALRPDERLCFLGDSITQAGATPGGYVDLLRTEMQQHAPKAVVLPAGISGHKVPNLLAREERDVRAKEATLVFLYIGINDVWHSKNGRGTPKAEFQSGLVELLRRFQGELGAAVALSTPSVIGEKRAGENSLDAMLAEFTAVSLQVAKSAEASLDLNRAFLDHLRLFNTANAEKGVLTSDGVHLNDAGNVFVATEAAHAIRRAALARESQ